MEEFDLIERIKRRFASVDGVHLSIGDDCAILEPGRFDLVTVDTMVEGVHFDRALSTPEDIGWKLLATNLSDIAAMGGAPGPCFLSLSLGPNTGEAFVEGLVAGMSEAAEALIPSGFESGVAGGDTTRTAGPTVLSLTLLGESSPTGPIRRSGALPGDRVVLIGAVGMAAAGLMILQEGLERDRDTPEAVWEAFIRAHRRPHACVLEGALMGHHGLANALIDVSDGLIQDLKHVLKASGAGARIQADRIAVDAAHRRLAFAQNIDLWSWLLAGGDDYALLGTVSPDRMVHIWQLAQEYNFHAVDIGEVRDPREGLSIWDGAGRKVELERWGYTHSFDADNDADTSATPSEGAP